MLAVGSTPEFGGSEDVHHRCMTNRSWTARPVVFSSMPAGCWQVAWLGEVNFHRRHKTYSQPTIEVVLLEFAGQVATAKVCVPVAQLWALSIGSVWQDGVLSGRAGDGEERDLEFAVSQVQACAAGVPIELGMPQFLLPFGEHPHHRGDTMSPCLRVRIGAEHVIFPAIELVRFYFGSSGALLKSVLSSSFKPEWLCAEHSIDEGRHAQLSLASGVPAASAEDIARMLFSSKARQAALLVSRSLIAGAAVSPEAKVYPKTEFPFDGTARLQVRGVSLEAGDGMRRFLVREIVTCGAKLPWSRLEVAADRSTRSPTSSTGTADSEASAPISAANAARSRRASGRIEPNEPKSSSAVRLIPIRAPLRFTDLKLKPTQRVAGKSPSIVSVQAMPAAAFESTGRGLSSSTGGRVDQHLATPDHDDRFRLEHFRCKEPLWAPYFELLTMLSRERWIDAIQFVALENRNPYVVYGQLPALVDEDGVVLEETLPDAQARRRPLISCANLVAGGVASAIMSLCPRYPGPRNRVFLWPGQRIDTVHALRAAYECLSDVPSGHRVRVPLDWMPQPPKADVCLASDVVCHYLRKVRAERRSSVCVRPSHLERPSQS